MKEKETEKLIQKRVSTDTHITVDFDSSKSNQNSNSNSKKNTSAWTVLAILISTLLAVMFAETMLLPALPDIMREFKISYSTSAWIFSAYLIVAAVMTPISGKLSDMYGKKKLLLLLLAIYTISILAGGFANSITFLIVSRVIQGVSLSAVPVAFSIVRDVFPANKLAIAVGIFGSAYSGGSVVGLLVGASIIQSFGWHTTFFFIAPVAAVVTAMISRFVRADDNNNSQLVHRKGEKEGANGVSSTDANVEEVGINDNDGDINNSNNSKSIDIKGAITLSATIISFLIALTLLESGGGIASSASISELQIPCLLGIAVVSLTIFVFIERRTESPLVDLKLLKHKSLLPSYLILMSIGITMFLVYPTVVQLVRSPQPIGFGGNAVTAANVQLPFMIIFLVFASATAFIISKVGSMMPTIAGTIIAVVGTSSMLMFHSSELMVSTNLAIIAAGLSLASTSIWNIIVSSAPKQYVGISVGIGALLFFLGMAIGPAIAGMYMQKHQVSVDGISGSFPSSESYNMVFLTAAILSIVSISFSVILKGRMQKLEVNNAQR
ncbi:MAG: MFS transporter [Nitrososphaeraceae archaeon]